MKRAMGWRRKAVTNYCRLRGGKGIGRWWDKKIGRVEDAGCPRCREEEQTPEHIVFRCRKVRRVKDERGRGRREWAKEAGMRWDSWDALASKKWVRMEDSGRVDDDPGEGRFDGSVLRGRAPSNLDSMYLGREIFRAECGSERPCM